MDFATYFTILLAAGALALVATPVVIRVATRLNALDQPDGCRKHQTRAVPLGGGLAIALAAGAVALWAIGQGSASFSPTLTRGLLPAAAVLILVGMIDDFVGLTGIYKLIGQMLAATLLAAGGAQFHSFSLGGADFDLGSLALPFSVFFILGAINAFNLIDGSDGLAGAVGCVVLATVAGIAAAQHAPGAAVVGFALTGALLGFLPYNWAPAKIYLGDTGSMLIGLVVAFVAVDASIKTQAAAALIVPIAGCAIPILDAAAALVRRITTGQSVFAPDRGHLHHALLLRGLSVRQTALAAAGLTAVTCAGAAASYATGHDWPGLVAVALVVVGLATLRVFGHAEAQLVASHARSGWAGLWRRVRRNAVVAADTNHEINIQGRRAWNDLWTALRETAPKHGLCGLRLNINIPRLHESFYGNWRVRDDYSAAADEPWRMVLPLRHGAEPIGKLTILGAPTPTGEHFDPELLALFLEPLSDEIDRIVRELAPTGESVASFMSSVAESGSPASVAAAGASGPATLPAKDPAAVGA
ncbi:MAG: undecaprenyl/decaprenyl-phosphate alpha-N-acetylglucosaminyl 1-phosphate transferase [Pirellulales bacterium]|nr:undecaprenyl/decaprenyl-phosphate alpha-N-acetylglucosaminyl 1-phosphate transferase [Pirellulales bacterium]